MKKSINDETGSFHYGVIGNCRSAALVSRSGSIDWCCLPDFSSSSVFAALLDAGKGGRFGIEPEALVNVSQAYEKDTNILVTRYDTETGSFEVIDFMPRYHLDSEYYTPPELIRYLRPLSGKPVMRTVYDPKLAYARHATVSRRFPDYIKSTTGEGVYESVYLYTNFNFDDILESRPVTLDGEMYFLFGYNQKLVELDPGRIRLEYERTKVYWLNWVDRTVRFTFAAEVIVRSALVLKLLTFQPSGAILAAVTTSLPESIGDVRNWDYRYCWIRDASMTITTLAGIGHFDSAHRFLEFILDILPLKDEKIQIMYSVKGEKVLEERELSWLSGYLGSRPVRVGNAAYLQKQNDIYGVLLDVLYQYFRIFQGGVSNREDLWTIVRGLARAVRMSWMEPDKGIWEFRSGDRHFVFSKVLSWTAADRAAKIAAILGREKDEKEWTKLCREIRADIMEKGWNPRIGAFTQSYGSDNTDAANLLMQTYGFIDAGDPKYVSTVLRTRDELMRNGLMYRYRTKDDFGEPQTSFTVCTLWMIKSLYLIGERDEARSLFTALLEMGNHLGLFSEGIDFETRRLLGNFPQGYSHLALIDAAITLSGDHTEDKDRVMPVRRRSGK